MFGEIMQGKARQDIEKKQKMVDFLENVRFYTLA